jgi:hypothetical protein
MNFLHTHLGVNNCWGNNYPQKLSESMTKSGAQLVRLTRLDLPSHEGLGYLLQNPIDESFWDISISYMPCRLGYVTRIHRMIISRWPRK